MISLAQLNTPEKIQDFLDSIPFNFEQNGETCMSPMRILTEKRAHCIEGAMLAAAALQTAGHKPLVMNLKVLPGDDDHVVALYRCNGYWGAISKTNHAVLQFRDPIYRTIHELAASYFHEYFLTKDGAKTLRGYSLPINLNRFGKKWVTAQHDLWNIAETIFDTEHVPLVPAQNKKYIRSATPFQRKITSIPEWNKNGTNSTQ